MDSLHIDANIVPVIYRIRVTDNGETVGEGTHQCLPSEIAEAAERVRVAMVEAGYTDAQVSYWAA